MSQVLHLRITPCGAWGTVGDAGGQTPMGYVHGKSLTAVLPGPFISVGVLTGEDKMLFIGSFIWF